MNLIPQAGFWLESRVFSIASAPGQSEVEIVYSVKGRYTKLMEQRLKPGYDLWLKLPYGDFIVDSYLDDDQDVVRGRRYRNIAVSALHACLEELRKKNRKVRLYYGVRDSSMILAMDLLETCSKAGLIDVRVFIENEDHSRKRTVQFELNADALISTIFMRKAGIFIIPYFSFPGRRQ